MYHVHECRRDWGLLQEIANKDRSGAVKWSALVRATDSNMILDYRWWASPSRVCNLGFWLIKHGCICSIKHVELSCFRLYSFRWTSTYLSRWPDWQPWSSYVAEKFCMETVYSSFMSAGTSCTLIDNGHSREVLTIPVLFYFVCFGEAFLWSVITT